LRAVFPWRKVGVRLVRRVAPDAGVCAVQRRRNRQRLFARDRHIRLKSLVGKADRNAGVLHSLNRREVSVGRRNILKIRRFPGWGRVDLLRRVGLQRVICYEEPAHEFAPENRFVRLKIGRCDRVEYAQLRDLSDLARAENALQIGEVFSAWAGGRADG